MESNLQPPQQPKNKKANFFSDWLEQLQQESWQLELLISGLALFGIWESRESIQKLEYYFDVNIIHDYQFFVGLLMMVLWGGWAIFLTNLLIHIIIRGLWIGAIGLRYVSGDIDFDTFNYSEVFINYYKKRIGSFDQYIERLEKISSVLFSFTFLLFFMFVSLAAFSLSFALAARIIESFVGESIRDTIPFLAMAYYGFGLLVLIDFLTLGAFKKVKDRSFSLVYFWIYRFYSTVSLSFIFRPLLLNFIDNKYTRRLFFLAIPYTLVVLVGIRGVFFEKNNFIPSFNPELNNQQYISEVSINWRYYDDLREEHIYTFNNGNSLPEKRKIHFLSLDQYENNDNVLSVFLEFQSEDDEHLQEMYNLSPFTKKGIGHRLFARGKIKDPGSQKIDSIYTIRRKLMEEVIRHPDKEQEESLVKTYSDDIEIWKNRVAEDISNLREELISDRKAQQQYYFENKLKRIKTGIIKMHTFKIDNREVYPSESFFMTHPNMHERGVVCYFPLDSLSHGGHIINIKKQRERKECKNGCSPSYFSLPFRKL